MKKHCYKLIVLFSACAFAQISPQSKKVTNAFFPDFETLEATTPAFQKKKGFTNYKELITFLTALVDQHPERIVLTYIGESQKGKEIPFVRLTNPNTTPKIKVWMQGGLHGNEPASTEGMLYLLDKLLNDESYSQLLDEIDLGIIPMANIDGYLKQNRYAANGLDLNRDQTKLMAPETVLIKQAFSAFNPEVGLDFHEYRPYRKDYAQFSNFGITALYDAMFLYSGNLNVPENLRSLTDNLFVKNAEKRLEENNLRHHEYVSTSKYGGEIHFNQGSTNARSSATNIALTNTVSTLFEIRGVGIGRTSFKRRTYITFLMAISYMETAAANSELVKKEIQKAVEHQNQAVVTSTKSIYKDSIQAIDLDSNKVIDLEVTIRDGLQAIPKLIRNRPSAYLIDANQTELIVKLKILGVTVETLDTDQSIEVQTYKVTTFNRDTKKYEKMNLQSVETALSTKTIQFPKGTFKVGMNQRKSNIIIEVLEPEAPNSFVSFGVLKTEMNQTLPIYRITKEIK